MSTDPFYMRYYSGHVGSYGHEFIEFEISGNRLRFALNTNYRNEGLLRREMYLSDATLKEFQRIVAESEITKSVPSLLPASPFPLPLVLALSPAPERAGEDDSKWPQKSVIGKQEFECRMAPYHLAFQIFVYSLISLHFHIKPRHYTIEGTPYDRNGFIGEYIRRRTGVVRDLHQVLYRLDAVIRAATGDLTEVAKLRSTIVPREELRLREWTTFLGPDLFPHTKPKHSSAKEVDETDDETPRANKKKRKTQSSSASALICPRTVFNTLQLSPHSAHSQL
ncbi:hypothetical protein Rt10032_c16g5759 [Rhodotorula toruloides]|uniref:Protein mago nashi n=1 Tax=Rhodotorula toruloides TaxID=5286 RepID=A0A511KMY3_RHOTO|nr:hypothetical protein Rt10032_c16g5759 [Rhodotorula toruloides]